ncbi:ABC transporter permease [Hathewaya massiliensis]|uniref:ABC transporter permease n=1 Tax=Hathewaya massiliensis TaxID=1964382 RepID=UPI00163BBA37|nr:FtsX-like permease family protein [Hathewaya massiliensis]
MKFSDYIKNAFLNLKRRKFRTFLTAFAISIGTMLIVLIMGLGIGTEKYVIENVKKSVPMPLTEIQVMSYNNLPYKTDADKNLKKTIEEKDIEKIKAMPEVKDVSVSVNTLAQDIEIDGKKLSSSKKKDNSKKDSEKTLMSFNSNENPNGIAILGVNTKYTIFSDAQIEKARLKKDKKDLNPIKYGENISNKNEILIHEKTLETLGFKDFKSLLGKEVKLTISLPKIPGYKTPDPIYKTYKIKGIINKDFEDTPYALCEINEAGEMLNYLNGNKDYFKNNGPLLSINTKDMNKVDEVSKKVEGMKFKTESIQGAIKQIKTGFAIIEGLLLIGAIIVIFVAAIGVINTMTMSIYERTRSIGIMKALGASKKNILGLFVTESAALGFLGGLIGIILSLINSKILLVFLNAYIKKQGVTETVNIFSTPIWLILSCIGFSMLISIIAGLIPSFRASKLDPIESLKYE